MSQSAYHCHWFKNSLRRNSAAIKKSLILKKIISGWIHWLHSERCWCCCCFLSQAAGILSSRLRTDNRIKNLAAELWRRRLPAAPDADVPQQHPLHQSPAEREPNKTYITYIKCDLIYSTKCKCLVAPARVQEDNVVSCDVTEETNSTTVTVDCGVTSLLLPARSQVSVSLLDAGLKVQCARLGENRDM